MKAIPTGYAEIDPHYVISIRIQDEQDRLELVRILLENGYSVQRGRSDDKVVCVKIPVDENLPC